MEKFFPPPEVLIELEPEQAGSYLLLYLINFVKENQREKIHRYNDISPENQAVRNYAGSPQMVGPVGKVLAEAWAWLRTEGFLVPVINENSDDWVSISRRGHKIESREDFQKFTHIKLLPKSTLDPKLADKVWPIFIKGDFDTAVFAAFKEVEVRTREVAELPETLIGVDLMRAAFDPEKGPLADQEHADKGERDAYSHLFAGAIGAFKNPGSHRDVNYDDPNVATGLILFANTLLRILEKRKSDKIAANSPKAQLEPKLQS